MPNSRAAGRLCAPLLDRLADDAPDLHVETGDGGIGITVEHWRRAMVRDLHDLLNTARSVGTSRSRGTRAGEGCAPEVEASVLGYGLPPLAGRPVASCDVDALAAAMALAVRRFEPRLVPGSLHVAPQGRRDGTLHVLRFRIEARLRTRPVASALVIRTEVDVDSGRAQVEGIAVIGPRERQDGDAYAAPGVDPTLLSRYLLELRHLRHGAAEFAREHPKVAARLGLDGGDEMQPCADPHVERLLEGFAFLAARVHHQIDASHPRFTRHLLERLLPHHAAPTPSIAVVAIDPDLDDPALSAGPVVPAGSVVIAGASSTQAPCRFRSGHALRLWPLRVAGASWRTAGGDTLCLRLAVTAGLRSDQLALDVLDLHLAGDEATAHALHTLLCERLSAIDIADGRAPETLGGTLPRSALEPFGAGPDEALLPSRPDAGDGARLLKEYAACPARLLFLRLTGLGAAVRRLRTPLIELRFRVDRADAELQRALDAVRWELHATPVVNLHLRRADRLLLDPDETEHRVIVDRMRPDDHEVHALHAVVGFDRSGLREVRTFVPLHETERASGPMGNDPDGRGRYAWRRAPARPARGRA